MKVHLIRTPEYPLEEYLEVLELLQSFDGAIQFVGSLQSEEKDKLFANQFPILNQYWKESRPIVSKEGEINISRPFFLGFIFLEEICKHYRFTYEVQESSFVVLLSNRRDKKNWFSRIDKNLGNNIFVATGNWARYIKCDNKYPIAYEICAYILRYKMKINNSNLHVAPIGCMNDYCEDKTQIVLKLRTADICNDCMDQIEKKKVPTAITNQVLTIFENIRLQMLFKQGFRRAQVLSKLKIDADYRITLPDYGEIEITLGPIPKSIYFLFLNHPEGIAFADMPAHQSEFRRIYREVSEKSNEQAIDRTVENVCCDTRNGFPSLRKYCNDIKKELDKKVGNLSPSLLMKYHIEGEKSEARKISLERSNIDAFPTLIFLKTHL